MYDYFSLAFVVKVIFLHRRVRFFTFRVVMYAHPQLYCVDLCRLSVLEIIFLQKHKNFNSLDLLHSSFAVSASALRHTYAKATFLWLKLTNSTTKSPLSSCSYAEWNILEPINVVYSVSLPLFANPFGVFAYCGISVI